MISEEEEESLISPEKDINYRLVLLEKQAKDKKEKRPVKKTKNVSKRPRKKEKHVRDSPPPKKRKQRPVFDDDDMEDQRSESEIDNDNDLDSSREETEGVSEYYKEAQRDEQSKMDRIIEEKRQAKKEKQDLLVDYGSQVLARTGGMVDSELGYDGSFGQEIQNDSLAKNLIRHSLSTPSAMNSFYGFVSTWGLPFYLVVRYCEHRPGLLGGAFQGFFTSTESAEPVTNKEATGEPGPENAPPANNPQSGATGV